MIEREMHGDIAVLRLAHGKVNALDAELLQAIIDRLSELVASPPAAVVLTGTGAVFSAGADLFRVLDEGEPYIEASLPRLSGAFTALFSFPRPVVAAVNGHAIAGGCILVSACDHRVMARGAGTIGVAELRVGVPYPTAALEILRFAAGAGVQELAYLGEAYPPEEALRRGLIDELAEPDALMGRALEVAARLARIPAASFAHTKRALRAPTLERIASAAQVMDPEAVRLWASPGVRASISSFLDELFPGRRRA